MGSPGVKGGLAPTKWDQRVSDRVEAIPVRAKKTPDLEKLTFRAGFSSADFRSKSGTEMAGKWQSVRRKTCRLAHFEARELSYPKMTFPGTFWNLQNQEIELKIVEKPPNQVPTRIEFSDFRGDRF